MLLTPKQPEEPRWGFFVFSIGIYGIIVVTIWAVTRDQLSPSATKVTKAVVVPLREPLPLPPDVSQQPVADAPAEPVTPIRERMSVRGAENRLDAINTSNIAIFVAGRIPLQGDPAGDGPPPSMSLQIFQPSRPTVLAEAPTGSKPVVKSEDIEPPVITYEPTVSKQARGIHGEVVLAVNFRADGGIEVLRIVHSLGPVPDAEARRIALGMRFEPAHTDSGRVVDYQQQLHITFG